MTNNSFTAEASFKKCCLPDESSHVAGFLTIIYVNLEGKIFFRLKLHTI